MTERLADLESRIGSMHELHDIVTAMRGLAAMRVQEAERALASTRAYAGIIEQAVARALGLLPPADRLPGKAAPTGVVLFGAEHGLAGDFNTRAIAGLPADARLLFVAGTRAASICAERGLPVVWSCAMATHVGAITTTARYISEQLYRRFSRGELGGVAIARAEYSGGTRSKVTYEAVLPAAPPAATENGLPPLLNLPPAGLLEQMLEEYLFAALAHAAMESFASENAARLATMHAARLNVDEKLDQLAATARAVRQDEITAELLDISTGAEAAMPSDLVVD